MRTAAACLTGALLSGLGQPAPPSPAQLAGSPVAYCAVDGDSIEALAARFGVDAATIARRNGLRPGARLTVGLPLQIDAVHIVPEGYHTIVVNLPQRMLFVRTDAGGRAFPIAAGRPAWQTPARGPAPRPGRCGGARGAQRRRAGT